MLALPAGSYANVDATTYDALPVGRENRSIVAFLPHANTSYYTGDPVNRASGQTGTTSLRASSSVTSVVRHCTRTGDGLLTTATVARADTGQFRLTSSRVRL